MTLCMLLLEFEMEDHYYIIVVAVGAQCSNINMHINAMFLFSGPMMEVFFCCWAGCCVR